MANKVPANLPNFRAEGTPSTIWRGKTFARWAAEERVIRERMVPRIAKAMGFSNADIDKILVEINWDGDYAGRYEPSRRHMTDIGSMQTRPKIVLPAGEEGYRYLRFATAHELGHHKDWTLNPTKVKNYGKDIDRLQRQNYGKVPVKANKELGIREGWRSKKISRHDLGAKHGTDALRMETYANREAAKYLKSLGGKDVLGPEVKKIMKMQEFQGKNFLLGNVGEALSKHTRDVSHSPYRYGAHMMRKAGLMGLLLALGLPMFMGQKGKE